MIRRKHAPLIRRLLLLFICGVLIAGVLPGPSARAEEDEFPEGMTESEKQQMLQEMEEDIKADKPVSIPGNVDYSQMTDQEARELLEEILPDEVDIEAFISNSESKVMEQTQYVDSYDAAGGLYRYIFPMGGSMYLSVPLGGWTDSAVVLKPSEDVAFTAVAKDGKPVTEEIGTEGAYFFREPGNYSFIAYEVRAEKRSYLSGTFRIIDLKMPVTQSVLWAPEGYRVGEVVIDGAPQAADEYADGRYLELTKDGVYSVTFEAKSAGLPETYRSMFVRDTTAPVVEWDGELHGDKFTGDIRYSKPESDTQVSIWYNGQPAVSETHVISMPGNYFVIASDPSGNARTYSFLLEYGGRMPWKYIGAVAGVFFLVCLAVVLTAKRGLRVR